MIDIEFDILTREAVTAKGDFFETSNPSVQYGGILCYAHAFNVYIPILGVEFGNTLGGSESDAVYLLNLWKQQATADGAKIANWSIKSPNYSTIKPLIRVDYV